jgi:type I restriction enzyme S subunit
MQFQSARVQDWLVQNAIGTTMPSLNHHILSRVLIPVPPTQNEQESIAETLDDVVTQIETLEQVIAKKRLIKKGVMQELLTGTRRLPGFGDSWETSTIRGEFDVQLGKTLGPATNAGELKPYLNNRLVQWGRIDTIDVPRMELLPFEQERYRLRVGDLLVCEGGEVGRAAIWEGTLNECYYQNALHRLRPVRGYSPRLMLEFLRYWSSSGTLTPYVTQTSIAHLSKDKFVNIPLPVPPCQEQRTIVAVLDDMDTEITALEARLAKAHQIKVGMMQELLTGRTRLM